MNESKERLISFSSHLVVALFAVFAFCSSNLLASENIYVKIIYVVSLLFALVSMNYGFQSMMVFVNYSLKQSLNMKLSETTSIPYDILNSATRKIQRQYYWSTGAWVLLTLSITLQAFQSV